MTNSAHSRYVAIAVLRGALLRVAMFFVAASAWSAGAASVCAAPVDFQQDVAPTLVRRCLACHGETKFKGEYQLHTIEALFKAGESGEPVITPSQPNQSRLLVLLRESDASQRMPLNADPLPAADIELIERWIAEGAKTGDLPRDSTLVNVARRKHPTPPESYRRAFPVTALSFAPDGKELAVGGFHEVTIWNVADGALVRRLRGVAERTYALAYSQDGTQLAVASGTPGQFGELSVLQAADGTLVRHFGSFADCALTVAFSPDQQRLAVAGADGFARVFEVASGQESLRIKDHSDWIMSLGWSPDGGRLVTASRDKTCKVFDAKSGQLVTAFGDHNEPVYCVAYHPDGKHAISAGADGRIRVWIAEDPGWENPEKMDKKKRHQVGEANLNSPIQAVALAPSEDRFYACGLDSSVRQFDLGKRNSLRSLSGHQNAVFALAYHAGSKRLASAGWDGRVRIWDPGAKDEKTQLVLEFVAAPGQSTAAATSSESR